MVHDSRIRPHGMNRHHVAIRFDSIDRPIERHSTTRDASWKNERRARENRGVCLTRSNDARHAESGATSDGGRVRSSSRRDAESRAGAFDRARATRARGRRARGTGEWTMKNMYRRVGDRDRVDRSRGARERRSIDRSRLGGIITETSTRARPRCARDERTRRANERTTDYR